jgi:hypothetical protein
MHDITQNRSEYNIVQFINQHLPKIHISFLHNVFLLELMRLIFVSFIHILKTSKQLYPPNFVPTFFEICTF